MKPSFAALKAAYYSSDPASPSYLAAKDLYALVGLDIDNLIAQDPGYINTCATRVSIALLGAKVSFVGRVRVKSGPHKGQRIESGAKLLADQLLRPEVLGRPEILDPTKASAKIGVRTGIVFFHKITGYGGGHIDLIESGAGIQLCASHCYFDCKEVWFWDLP